MTRILFVYGTLRNASPVPMVRRLAERAAYLGEGKIAGRLFDLGRYPGLVAAEGDDEWVFGDLYDLGETPDRILTELDRYEGTEYERRFTDATKADGWFELAWAYWYLGEVREEQRIASGRWQQPGLPFSACVAPCER